MPEIATSVKDLFLNPRTYDPSQFDTETARLLRATIDYFEGVGKTELLRRDHDAVWVTDYLDFVKREKLFSTFLTGADYADGDENRRWDTSRNAALSEILGFYGLAYWYAEQVTILGLGPIWMSGNEEAKRKAAAQLADGGVMAFGLSERAHGADVYSTDMLLTPDGEGGFTADGTKYYIGNGNVAGMVSVFGRRTDIDGPEGYVFFVADSSRPDYRLIDNVTHGQMYVSTFALEKYTVTEADILHTGPEAFAAALNTVNIGKFNLCSGSVGMVEHSFYESITHAHNRILYGHPVTDFSHVREILGGAFPPCGGRRLSAPRAADFSRGATLDDRRYLLFNPMTKSKVTSEGEKVMTLLLDVVAAKGYEKSTYFHQANHYIGWLPRLEGTVHVNVSQILKFMPNYFFNPAQYPAIGTRADGVDDSFFWAQGPVGGTGTIRFDDWTKPYEEYGNLPNVAVFYEQAKALKDLLSTAGPSADQQKDLDFLLTIGHLFSLVVYGQLILEQAKILDLDPALIDQIFVVSVRDFSAYAVTLHGATAATEAQQQWALGAIRAPHVDDSRFGLVWDMVASFDGAYEMPA